MSFIIEFNVAPTNRCHRICVVIMDIKEANEIIACLPKERTLFRYYEDRYAAILLERLAGNGVAISDIKASAFAKLLTRPSIKQIVAGKGNGLLRRGDLLYVWPGEVEPYVLTLGLWGANSGDDRGWLQISRRGVNLVLQLNFSRQHDRLYHRLVDPCDRQPFVCDLHPVCTRGRNTLAWARIDLDFATGEALIEEIQNDWIRRALRHRVRARRALYNSCSVQPVTISLGGPVRVRASDVVVYADEVLRLHRRFWADAMLAAAIWFLTEEIGITRIWYHDHETGARVKRIRWGTPPRSLYTDLPRRFCFERTCEAPGFIAERAPKRLKRRIGKGRERFWRLYL